MMRKDQGNSNSSTGGFESTLVLDCSVLSSQMIGLLGRRNEEANIPLGPMLQVHSTPHINIRELNFREPPSSGLAYPPYFED